MNVENLIKTGTRNLTKLIGDMTRTKKNIDTLRGAVDSLDTCAEKVNETATKEYLATTTKINAAKVDAITRIVEETTKMKTLLIGSSSNLPSDHHDNS